MPIRILLIEKHQAVRRALRTRLSSPSHLEVVGAAPDLATAAEQIRTLQPDVIVLGLQTGPHDELASVAQGVQAIAAETAVIIALTPFVDAMEREMLIAAGARRYLLKHINSAQLIREIEAVAPRPAEI